MSDAVLLLTAISTLAIWLAMLVKAKLNGDWKIEINFNKYHEGWIELVTFSVILSFLVYILVIIR